MKIITSEIYDSTQLSIILWYTVKPIAPEGTTGYTEILHNSELDLDACQILVDGFGWELIEPVLTELNIIDDIIEANEQWRES